MRSTSGTIPRPRKSRPDASSVLVLALTIALAACGKTGVALPVEQRIALAGKDLSSPDIRTRLVGIAELARIERESDKDGARISEMLVAYLHQHAACTAGLQRIEFKVAVSRCDRDAAPPEPDVQAALAVLGGRSRAATGQALDLSATDLRRADLTKLHLEKALIAYAHLGDANLTRATLDDAMVRGVNLDGANLEHASMRRINLSYTSLRGANLQGAQLPGANLWHASLERARLAGADLAGAQMQGVELRKARLEGIDLRATKRLAQEQIDQACTDEHTVLPPDLNLPPPCGAD